MDMVRQGQWWEPALREGEGEGGVEGAGETTGELGAWSC